MAFRGFRRKAGGLDKALAKAWETSRGAGEGFRQSTACLMECGGRLNSNRLFGYSLLYNNTRSIGSNVADFPTLCLTPLSL